MKNNILYLIIFFLSCLLIVQYYHNLHQDIDTQQSVIVSTDSIIYYRNELGFEVAKNELIRLENATQLETLRAQSKELKRLAKLIKQSKPKEIYTVINSETKIDTIMKLDTIVTETDFRKDFTLDKWAEGIVAIRKDTLALALSIYNEYDVTIGSEKGHSYAEVTNHNPYTKTTLMRALQVVDKRRKKHIHIGPTVGYAATPNGLEPYIGIGITYSILSL